MKRFGKAMILLLLLAGVGLAQAEERPRRLIPEEIDIYSYDPTPQETANVTGYPAAAQKHYEDRNYELAARYYLAYLSAQPQDATAWYNLSCCYGLLGSAKEAAKYLKVAYKYGFKDLKHIEQDKDFEAVRTAKTFTATMDSLRQWNEKETAYQGQMEYFRSEQYVPYWIHLPKDYDANRKYTLVIGLHGFGDKARNFSGLWAGFTGNDIIYVVPEAPYPFLEGTEQRYSWMPLLDMSDPKVEKAYFLLSDYLVRLTKSLEKRYKIRQTWLLGFSQGAYYGYMLSIKNPKVFDGLIACGGGLMTEVFKKSDYKKAKQLEIIISHGRQDEVVRFSEAENAYSVLKGKGMKVRLDAFDGGHQISPSVIPAFLDRIR